MRTFLSKKGDKALKLVIPDGFYRFALSENIEEVATYHPCYLRSNEKYIVRIPKRKRAGRTQQIRKIEVDRTLALETAYTVDTGDLDSMMAWIEQYDIPIKCFRHFENDRFRLKSGPRIDGIASIEECRMCFNDVMCAGLLWQGVETKNTHLVRQALQKMVREEGKLDAIDDDLTLMKNALWNLQELVNCNLSLYPPEYRIYVEENFERELYPRFIFELSTGSAISYIWKIIADGLSNPRRKNRWLFKTCVDCKKWIDISPPEHRKSRSRCDKCDAEYRKEESLKRTRKIRSRQKEQNSRL